MKEQKKGGFSAVLSAVYLVCSMCLLLLVCSHCYPQYGQKLRQVIAGATDGPAREAFSVLTQGLTERQPVKEVLSQSYEVLTGDMA